MLLRIKLLFHQTGLLRVVAEDFIQITFLLWYTNSIPSFAHLLPSLENILALLSRCIQMGNIYEEKILTTHHCFSCGL